MNQRRHSRWVDMHMLRPNEEIKPLVEQLMYRCDDVAALVGLGCAKKEGDMGLVEIALGNLMASEKQIQRKNSRVMEWLDRTTLDRFATEIASGSEGEPTVPHENDPIDWDATRAPTPTSDQGLECGDASDHENVPGESSSGANRRDSTVGEKSVTVTAEDRSAVLQSALSEISTKLGASQTADVNAQAQDIAQSDAQSNDHGSKVQSIIKGFEVMTVAQSPACTPRKTVAQPPACTPRTPRRTFSPSPACTPRKLQTPRDESSTARDPSARQGLPQNLFSRASSGGAVWNHQPLASSTEGKMVDHRSDGHLGGDQPKLYDNEAHLAPPVGAELITDSDKMPTGLVGRERGVESVLRMLQLEMRRFETGSSDADSKREIQVEGLQDLSMPSPVLEAQQKPPALPPQTAQPSQQHVSVAQESAELAELEEGCYEIPSPVTGTTNSKLPTLTLMTKRPSAESIATEVSLNLSPNHEVSTPQPETHASPDGRGGWSARKPDVALANESADSPPHAWTICVPQAERMAEDVHWHVRTNQRNGEAEALGAARANEDEDDEGLEPPPKMSTSPSDRFSPADRFSLFVGGPVSPKGNLLDGATPSGSSAKGSGSATVGLESILKGMQDILNDGIRSRSGLAALADTLPPEQPAHSLKAPPSSPFRRQDETASSQALRAAAPQTVQGALPARPPPAPSPRVQSIAVPNTNGPGRAQAQQAQAQVAHAAKPPAHPQAMPAAYPQAMPPRPPAQAPSSGLPATGGGTIQLASGNTVELKAQQQHNQQQHAPQQQGQQGQQGRQGFLQQQPPQRPPPAMARPAAPAWQQPHLQRVPSPMQRTSSPGWQQPQAQRPPSPGWQMAGPQRSFPMNGTPPSAPQPFSGHHMPNGQGLASPASGHGQRNAREGFFRPSPLHTMPMNRPLGVPSSPMQQWPGMVQVQQQAGPRLGGAFM